MTRGWSLSLATGLIVQSTIATAQSRPAVGVSAGGINVHTQTTIGSRRTMWQGFGLVAAGRLSIGPMLLHASYLQTSPAPAPAASAQAMVEAEANAGIQLLPWLALKSGARARAFVLPAGTRRWLLWELRTRLGGPIGVTWARGAVDLWTSLAGVSNVAERLESGRGGEAAFAARIPLLPAWLRVAYRIDAIRSSIGSRREVTEGLSVSIALGHGAP